jgi:hypothetical protein
MAVHVLFRELDADGKYTNSDHNAGELEGSIIGAFIGIISP